MCTCSYKDTDAGTLTQRPRLNWLNLNGLKKAFAPEAVAASSTCSERRWSGFGGVEERLTRIAHHNPSISVVIKITWAQLRSPSCLRSKEEHRGEGETDVWRPDPQIHWRRRLRWVWAQEAQHALYIMYCRAAGWAAVAAGEWARLSQRHQSCPLGAPRETPPSIPVLLC